MANAENVDSSIRWIPVLDGIRAPKRIRKTKYFREPLLSQMMGAIHEVRDKTRSVQEVAQERNLPCRTLRRYVEMSMDMGIISPFYYPLAINETPIGRKKKVHRFQYEHAQNTHPLTAPMTQVVPLQPMTANGQPMVRSVVGTPASPLHSMCYSYTEETPRPLMACYDIATGTAIARPVKALDCSPGFAADVLAESSTSGIEELSPETNHSICSPPFATLLEPLQLELESRFSDDSNGLAEALNTLDFFDEANEVVA